jgi:P27 family predicted phage terminase small subunit
MSDLEPPAYLNPEQRGIWTGLIQEIMAVGNIARVNPDQLASLVSATAQHRRATEILARTDILVNRGDGAPVANPAADVQRKAQLQIVRLRKEFGLGRTVPALSGTSRIVQGRWCEHHKRRECTGQKHGGGECHGIAPVGLDRCRRHCGTNVQRDVRHIAAVEEQRNPLAGNPLDISPGEALLWRVRVLSGEVQRLDDIVAGLERDEVVWGAIEEVNEEGGETSSHKARAGARIHSWVLLREMRERQLQSACESALRAGIEERMVRIAETDGAMILSVIKLISQRLGYADDPRIITVVPEAIREVISG